MAQVDSRYLKIKMKKNQGKRGYRSDGRAAVLAVASVVLIGAMPRCVLAQTVDAFRSAAQTYRPLPGDKPGRIPGGNAAPQTIPDPDGEFALKMRRRAAAELELAEAEMSAGADAQMRAIAQAIVDSRKREIEKLDAWLARRKPRENRTIPRML